MPLEAHSHTRRGERIGVVKYRSSAGTSFRRWQKRTPLSAYWLDRRHLVRSIEAIAPLARGVLLDVGGSESPYRAVFEPYVSGHFNMEYPPAILDKQPEMWDLLYSVNHLVNLLGDGARLPIRDGSVDTILCTEVLEHVPEPARLVAEMRRALVPGGKLLLTVPFIQPLHELPSDYYRYTPSSLRRLAESNGLFVDSIEPRGNFASANGAMLSQWLIRSAGAKRRQSDGSVILSRWRSVLVLPLTAIVQVTFHLLSKITDDRTVCHGYTLVATRPE